MLHEHRVLIPTLVGTVVKKVDFQRRLWPFLHEGGQQALRLRIEGRSHAKGKTPKWLKEATDVEFLRYGNLPGELVFGAPPVAEFLDWQEIQPLFPAPFTPADTALSLLEWSLEDAIGLKRDSDGLDDSLLDGFSKRLKPLLDEVGSMELQNGRALRLDHFAFDAFAQLKKETPARQWCRVTGKLDQICHSSHGFSLTLTDGRILKGVVEEGLIHDLRQHWGDRVAVEGQAVFRASGNVQRIEAHHITLAEEGGEIWSAMPQPLFPEFNVQTLQQPQGPKSGLAAIIGQWPGEETDEQIRAALKAMA